jgi:hypothetical protein
MIDPCLNTDGGLVLQRAASVRAFPCIAVAVKLAWCPNVGRRLRQEPDLLNQIGEHKDWVQRPAIALALARTE